MRSSRTKTCCGDFNCFLRDLLPPFDQSAPNVSTMAGDGCAIIIVCSWYHYPAMIAGERVHGTFRSPRLHFPRERPGGNQVKVTRTCWPLWSRSPPFPKIDTAEMVLRGTAKDVTATNWRRAEDSRARIACRQIFPVLFLGIHRPLRSGTTIFPLIDHKGVEEKACEYVERGVGYFLASRVTDGIITPIWEIRYILVA